MRLATLLAVLALAAALPAAAQDEQRDATPAEEAAQPGAQPSRLGYVDLRRAVAAVEDGQRAIEALTSQLSERQAELDSTEGELVQFREQLEQDMLVMDAESRNEALAQFQERVMAYQEQFLANQQQLSRMEVEATSEILARMLTIVDEIAAERGLEMVFEKTQSSLVWAADGTDLTEELIRRYEDRH